MDGEGNIVEWDAAAEEIFGWTRDEALGAQALRADHPGASARDARVWADRDTRRPEQGKFIGKPIEIVTLNRDGSEVPIAITISMEREGDGLSLPDRRTRGRKDPAG